MNAPSVHATGAILSRLTALALLAPRSAAAQEGPDSVGGFPYRAFATNEAVARWMFAYDRVAWITSDSVMAAPTERRAMLGGEWFCIERGSAWHAIYGRYDSATARYYIVFHYQGTLGSPFQSSSSELDSLELLAFARALHQSRAAFPDSLARTGMRFNQYVRRLPDQSIEIWYVPAQQTTGLVLWGAEVRHQYAPTGHPLLASTVTGTGLRGVYPDTSKVLDIDQRGLDVPSVGAAFFLLAHRALFRRIFVRTSRFVTTFASTAPGQYAWVHAVRDSTIQNPPK